MLQKVLRYTYLLWEEGQDYSTLWRKFTFSETLCAANETIPGLFSSAQDGLERHLLIQRNTLILIEGFPAAHFETDTLAGVLEQLLSYPFQSEQEERFGEAWLLVGEQFDFDVQSYGSCQTSMGLLAHQRPEQLQDTHFYYFIPNNQAETSAAELSKVLYKQFPLLDSVLFQTIRKGKFFGEQEKTMIRERSQIDSKLGVILHRQLHPKEDLADTSKLVDTIQELSQHYGALAGYASILANNLDVLKDDERTLSLHFQRLVHQAEPGNFFEMIYLKELKSLIEATKAVRDRLNLSLANAKAAIDVVQTQVELVRSAEGNELQQKISGLMEQNLHLSKEGIALQVAAAFIEFIVVTYYSLSIWKTLAPESAFHHIPALLKLGIMLLFAGTAVLCTHQVALVIQKNKKAKLGLAAAVFSLLSLFGLMLWLSKG